MALDVQLHQRGTELTSLEEERIRRQLASLEKRLAKFPDPRAELALETHSQQRRVRVDLRVVLGPSGGHLVSHQEAETADKGVKDAVADVKRQLERRLANQRGEPSYGVPSRRLPSDLRPNPPTGETDEEESAEDLTEASEEELLR